MIRSLQVALERSRDPAVVLDAVGRVLFSNRAARQAFGPALDAMGDASALSDAGFRSVLGSARTFTADEFPALRVLGGEPEATAEVCFVPANAPDVVAQVYRVTAVRVSEGLRNIEVVLTMREMTVDCVGNTDAFLRERALSATAEGVTICDYRAPDNPLVYVNDGFVKLTGYSREEALGRNCRFLQGSSRDEEACAAIRAAIRERKSCVVELINYRKDGTPFWNRLSITPVFDPGGGVTHFVGIQSDVTERIETAQRLRAVTNALGEVNDQLKRDLASAAQIQRAQLPPNELSIPRMRIAWHFDPCDDLAGDMLNIFQLDERHAAVYVLDVSGHGTGAALLSTSVSKLLQPGAGLASLVFHGASDTAQRSIMGPAHVLDELNKTFTWNAESNQFFTIVYAIVDTAAREFRFAGAGHPGPVVLTPDGTCRTLNSSGLPIGIVSEAYDETVVSLGRGDRVFLYTDGLVETMNRDGRLFGEDRLIEIARKHISADLRDTVSGVRDELALWRAGEALQDDVTLIAFELV